MRVVVIGCTESTKRIIKEILKNKICKIEAIVTLDDNLAYKKSRFVFLDSIAIKNNIKLHKLSLIKDQKTIKFINDLEPDLIIESGWSQIIPKEIIEIPKKGCVGIHYSYLPKNQGAASLNWAIIKNEKEWGVTLFYLGEKIDDGDIIDQAKFSIEEEDDINSLYDKADALVVELLRKNLPLIDLGIAPRIKQDSRKGSYLPKRNPEDGRINWHQSNESINRLVKALTKPYPGAFAFLNDIKVLIWSSKPYTGSWSGEVGEIVEIINDGIIVKTGKGNLLLEKLQVEGESQMTNNKFVKYYEIKVSNKFA